MKKKNEKKPERANALLPDLSDATINDLVGMAKNLNMPATARVLKAYTTLRKRVTAEKRKSEPRNCDVMTTAAALRKGWERRCEYGEPCCPFVYAMEPFYGEDQK